MSWRQVPITGILNHRVYDICGDFALVEGAFIIPQQSYWNWNNFLSNNQRRNIGYRRRINTKPRQPIKPHTGVTIKRSSSDTNIKDQNKNPKIDEMISIDTSPKEDAENSKPTTSQDNKETICKCEEKKADDSCLQVGAIDKSQCENPILVEEVTYPPPKEEADNSKPKMAEFEEETIPKPLEPEPDDSYLHVAIIDNHCKKSLTKDQMALIKRKIEAAIGKCSDVQTPPQFEKVDDESGYLFFKCANKGTRNWLERVLNGMEGLWGSADLIVVDADSVKKPKLRLTLYDKPYLNLEDLLKKIKYQNPELNVSSWDVLKAENSYGKFELIVLVDVKSFLHLQSKQFKFYYVFEELKFNVLEGLKSK